jgi:hypothetical protein
MFFSKSKSVEQRVFIETKVRTNAFITSEQETKIPIKIPIQQSSRKHVGFTQEPYRDKEIANNYHETLEKVVEANAYKKKKRKKKRKIKKIGKLGEDS